MNVTMGLRVEAAAVTTEYGPLRLRVAEWAGVDPAEVTPDQVVRYESAQEGRQP